MVPRFTAVKTKVQADKCRWAQDSSAQTTCSHKESHGPQLLYSGVATGNVSKDGNTAVIIVTSQKVLLPCLFKKILSSDLGLQEGP